MSEPEYYTTKFPWTRNLVMRTIGEEGWHHEGEILYGQDVVDAFFKPVESGGWSLEQKEAIRNRFALITQKVFTYGCLTGRGDALSVKQEEYIDKGLWVDELMAELEAITKGEEQ